MTAPATDAVAEAATEVVQKAAAPIAFIAIVIASALAVAALVKRFGRSLPVPAYLAPLVDVDDEDQDEDEPEEVDHDVQQWQ